MIYKGDGFQTDSTFDIHTYIESQNISDLKFERSQETQRIIFESQNMLDVMTIVFRKRGMYCFKSQKTCVLSGFKVRK